MTAVEIDHEDPTPVPLAVRMKSYEAATRMALPTNSFAVLRVDGKNFSTYTKGLARPYDEGFMASMDRVAEVLVASISGAVLAFTQSDEISVLFSDLSSPQTQMHHGGSVNKIVSLSAALATAAFNSERPGKTALFDARVFALPSAAEAVNCMLWRQRDATKNAVSMSAQAVYPHKSLQRVPTEALLTRLAGDGIDFESYPEGFRRGRLTTRHAEPGTVTYRDGRTGAAVTTEVVRHRWRTEPAPDFGGPALHDLLAPLTAG